MTYSTQNTSGDSEGPKRYRIKAARSPSCTLVAFLMLGLLFQTVQATDCTYRKDSLGNTRYQCDDGRSGTLRKDSLGNVRDSQSGTTWRKDSSAMSAAAKAPPTAKTVWAMCASADPAPAIRSPGARIVSAICAPPMALPAALTPWGRSDAMVRVRHRHYWANSQKRGNCRRVGYLRALTVRRVKGIVARFAYHNAVCRPLFWSSYDGQSVSG